MPSPQHIESVPELNMECFPDSDAANALAQLSQLTAEREAELAHYKGATDSSSDEEESDCLVMDKFTRDGSCCILNEVEFVGNFLASTNYCAHYYIRVSTNVFGRRMDYNVSS